MVSRDGKDDLVGRGFKASRTKRPATYRIEFDEDFAQDPIVLASAEHAWQEHVRQAQIYGVAKGQFDLDIYGFEEEDGKDERNYNDSVFHFIAYAPT